MRLIRSWEQRYLPAATGGLRLSKSTWYRGIGEENGLGDRREGEVRFRTTGEISRKWEPTGSIPPGVIESLHKQYAPEQDEEMRQMWAEQLDDPELQLKREGLGRWKMLQNVPIHDENIASPYLFCMSREPATHLEWKRMRASLPSRYGSWTVTEDVQSLSFEIECGIRRWMRQNGITQHRILGAMGLVTYPYELAPPSGDPSEVLRLDRWFRKRKNYSHQQEYRIAWSLSSPQLETMPEVIDIELTRTGLNLFQPWTPPV